MKTLFIGGSSAIAQSLKPYFKDYEVIEQSSRVRTLIDTDIVINFAGVSLLNPLSKASLINKRLIEVNCLGAVNLLIDYLPLMKHKGFGRIIFLSSVCAEVNLKDHGVYSASKSFVDKLVKIAALENGEYGITVNSIQLGYTGIGMSQSTPENMERQKRKSALKRFVTMQELYNTIDFMIKTEAITGQNINLSAIL